MPSNVILSIIALFLSLLSHVVWVFTVLSRPFLIVPLLDKSDDYNRQELVNRAIFRELHPLFRGPIEDVEIIFREKLRRHSKERKK